MDIDRPAGGAGDGPAKPRDSKYPNVVDEAAKCLRFIQEFEDDQGNKKYIDLLQRVANREEKVVTIELDDVLAHNRDESFVQAVLQNTRRYQTLFAKAIDTAMPAPSVDIRDPDVLDVLREQRMQNAGQEDFPVELMRRFEVHIKAPSSEKALPLRDVKAKYVGHLVTVKGIVTRMSEVRPLMRVATYVCDVCGYEIYQEVDSKEYMPLFECSSPVCKQNAQSKSGKLFPQIRGSRFVKFQDLKLQELPSEVPVGSIPRSLNVVVRGELTRRCVPGDIVTVTGIFLVTRQTGFRAINAGLTADTYLEVTHMEQHKKTHADLHISEDMLQQVEQRAQDVDIYTKLSKSIAPEIFGLEDVKRALLLLLVGGQTRVMSDGMKIRGDINILLLGDPGVAKSQLLKHISSIAPRGAYTTGKGSSGVGLTAAVIRDPITGEMTLEGGALVLADMGICCIDEFDKMEDSDRTAIHEVMEQQTVSIAKAGITTTLNARTSVLAAANPVMGRYNPNRTPEENIGLPTALLSRFDLTFILRDTPDEESDKALAQHVTVVHKTGKHPALSFEPFAPQFLRAYVNRARQYEPTINKELTDFIVGTYVEMRAESESVKDETRQRFCTARSLLSILRLSQALARLRFADEVDQHDVQEAVRLLFVTKQQDQDTKQRRKTDGSVTSEIYDIFVGLARLTKDHSVKYSALRSRAEKDGFTREDVEQMLTKYSELNVLHRSREGQTIRPVERGAE